MEMMMVVSIVGIVTSLGISRFDSFQARAKRAESNAVLPQIWTLQESYRASTSTYFGGASEVPLTIDPGTTLSPSNCNIGNALGLAITDCSRVRYVYAVEAGVTGNTFVASATEFAGRIFGPCTVDATSYSDTWTIDQDRSITNPVNSLAICL